MPDHTSKLLLGTLLCSPDLIESTDELDSSLFPRGRERDLFEIISSEWCESRPDKIDIVKASSRLDFEGAPTWVSSLLDWVVTYPIKTPEDFRKQVGELVKKKLAKQIFKKISEQANLGDIDLSEIKPLLTQYEVAGDKDRKLAEDVRTWVNNEVKGEFQLKQIYSVLGVVSINGQAGVRQILARMVKEGILDHCGKEYGRYRKVGKLADPIDIMSVMSKPLDLYLPLGLGELVNIYPKNIVVLAGESSRGKTALALDFVKNNMNDHRVMYFFKEGGPEELRARLEPHEDVGISDWKMLAFEHEGYIADAIDRDSLNVYDYLHVGDQAYYEIDKMFNDVQNKLHGGMALINIQKNRNKELGDGGDFSLRVPRLYVTLSADKGAAIQTPDVQYVVAKIEKAKSWKKRNSNPEGRIMPFVIREGWKIEKRNPSWEYPETIDTVKRKKIF
jgi:hypothetical protein